jgi:hypothetical protein
MTANSHLRGHPIYWDEASAAWRFADTDEPTAETWPTRPCGHCGLYGNSSDGEVDPCLGELAGVTNACCGHGNPEESYIAFMGGLVIRGFDIDTLHHRTFSDVESELISDHNQARRRFRTLPPGEGADV